MHNRCEVVYPFKTAYSGDGSPKDSGHGQDAVDDLENDMAGVLKRFLVLIVIIWSQCLYAEQSIKVFALFENKAIINIDGKRRVLAVGETSPEGLKLIHTDTRNELVEVEIAGRRETLRLGVVSVGGGLGSKGGAQKVVLFAQRGAFYADGSINGSSVKFLVDTGATTIAMNSYTADRIGLDYKRHGRRAMASTAGGIVPMYAVTLKKVKVGGIVMHNIEAGVIEGSHPKEVLLGMSFLSRVNMTRNGNKMELTKRY
ncbi:MAG: TIGR02281 family clan AA aspartic protease [Proteobacteria bacterium]|nr:TIGR02281 family clan AA aspartic protease [Pseudomonadota bacterium]